MSNVTLWLARRTVAIRVRADAWRRAKVSPRCSPWYSALKIPWLRTGPRCSVVEVSALAHHAAAPAPLSGSLEPSVKI